MTNLHLAIGLLAVAANVAATAWGAVVLVRRRPSPVFLALARAAQAITLAQVLLGILLLTGAGADEAMPSGTHILAAAGVLTALAVAEALGRIPARRRSDHGDTGLRPVALAGEGPAAVADGAPPGMGQTAVLTAGFLVVSVAAVLAVISGWH